jgi:Arc/MetJ-type ribon-helix-helix transcriptional regulator
MVKTRKVTVRVTKEQHERIKNTAHAKGFLTVSAFIRDFALRNPLTTELRIVYMDQRLRRMEKMLASLCSKFNLSDEIVH